MLLVNNKIAKSHTRKDITKSTRTNNGFYKGDISLFSKQSGKISMSQVLAVRSLLRKQLKRKGKVWSYLLTFLYISKKPNEVRLGKGKGNLKYKYCLSRKGKTIIELKGLTSRNLSEIITKSKAKTSTSFWFKLKHQRWIL